MTATMLVAMLAAAAGVTAAAGIGNRAAIRAGAAGRAALAVLVAMLVAATARNNGAAAGAGADRRTTGATLAVKFRGLNATGHRRHQNNSVHSCDLHEPEITTGSPRGLTPLFWPWLVPPTISPAFSVPQDQPGPQANARPKDTGVGSDQESNPFPGI